MVEWGKNKPQRDLPDRAKLAVRICELCELLKMEQPKKLDLIRLPLSLLLPLWGHLEERLKARGPKRPSE